MTENIWNREKEFVRNKQPIPNDIIFFRLRQNQNFYAVIGSYLWFVGAILFVINYVFEYGFSLRHLDFNKYGVMLITYIGITIVAIVFIIKHIYTLYAINQRRFKAGLFVFDDVLIYKASSINKLLIIPKEAFIEASVENRETSGSLFGGGHNYLRLHYYDNGEHQIHYCHSKFRDDEITISKKLYQWKENIV